MKRKLLILTIIMTLISPLFLSVYKVQAYTGEIDPENYITCPSEITIQNNIGTGTVKLSASATGYNISYQKIDITKEKWDSIIAKSDKLNAYIETSNQTIKEKKSNLNTLQTEYENLQNDETATEEQKTTARTNFETANADYSEYVDNYNAQIKTLRTEYLSLVPDYTSSWKTTTNSLNNIKLDFSNHTGEVYFILWVKIANGVNTYYEFEGYSSKIKEETKTDTEQSGNNNSTTTTEGEWTDFSNAKFELKKDGFSNPIVEISGITPKEGSYYYLYISSNNSKPTLDEFVDDKRIGLFYDENTNTLKSADLYNIIADSVELDQDLYATVVEKDVNGAKGVLSFGNKLTRYSEPKYSDAYSATCLTSERSCITTCFTHNSSNSRKIQIKVGKITDTSILNKIKNKNSTGFEELLSYATKNSGIYNETVNATAGSSFLEYDTLFDGQSVINLKGLENGAYYFLYIKTDDENGKYISNEAVTLAQYNAFANGEWSMFFYGSSDFKWANWDSGGPTDSTLSPNPLPNTGALIVTLCGALLLMTSLCGVVAYKKYKKYNF